VRRHSPRSLASSHMRSFSRDENPGMNAGAMSELRSIVEAARALRARGEAPLLATVVDVRGSAYRKPGARMIFSDERWLAGSISAGCLERDVVAKGPFRTRDGRAQLVTYDSTHDERVGTGCDGIIDVLIERAGGETLTCPLHFVAHCLREEQAGVLISAFRSTRDEVKVGARMALLASGDRASTFPTGPLSTALEAEAARTLASSPAPARVATFEDVTVLIEHVVPPPHLFLFGSAPDAVPVMQCAQSLGWTVSVCDERAQLTTRERFRAADHLRIVKTEDSIAALARCARPAAVAMAHHYERDLATLSLLLRSRVPYIGILGSRLRSTRLLTDLRARGAVDEASLAQRVHAPVGLPLFGESPREIALSIVAEIQQFFGRAQALTRAGGA
jgi:xanthine dehydrogenase accessory factor